MREAFRNVARYVGHTKLFSRLFRKKDGHQQPSTALFWNRFVVGIPKPAPIGKKRRPIIKKVQMGVVLIRCMDQDPRIDDFEGLTETGREVITVMVETTETTVAMVETRLLWKRSAIVSLPFSTIEIN
ncbi:uncharacterized protein LOC129583693 isoform X3 [Paramacrobiotus metropolitanus]|uniref:uncharacterized protein LOC129583693 isoform X3 n=1 Tax=Paramacrobiotus metropolitanus TaxID=2943436 RepID=UPI002445CE6A|nr:uncharacterized protein LOC129583693 isoform X3 [Paramacrobiotus metropolitanus]